MLNTITKAWRIGEINIAIPLRITYGLAVLADSPLNGNLKGREQVNAFARLLHENNIVHITRLDKNKQADVNNIGRKWRAAMMQLGFITDALYEITPNGRRLIETMNLRRSIVLSAEQECYLRSLLVYQIPSPLELAELEPVFSPLRIVLEVFAALERADMEAYISRGEMAAIVQLIRRVKDVDAAVETISKLREIQDRETTHQVRRRLLNNDLKKVADSTLNKQANALTNYADSNSRYLKTTGLFRESEGRLTIALHKRIIVKQILSKPYALIPDGEYRQVLWNGAQLPTDNPSQAIEAIKSLVVRHDKVDG